VFFAAREARVGVLERSLGMTGEQLRLGDRVERP
jgi:hypothetical protein